MPNPIKYNTSAETLALKKGNGFVRIVFLVIVTVMIVKYGYDVLRLLLVSPL